MAFNFDGKKVLITGAGRGIGRALAKSISSAGGQVYALSKTKEHLDSLVSECSNIRTVQVDLANWGETRRALESLEPMDGLVNNAGIGSGWASSLDIDPEILQNVFNVNTMAAVNVTQVIGKKMVENGKGGSIVNMSSILSINPFSQSLAYTMSKAAMDMMTKQFALELGPHNIRVNSVNPTVVKTDSTRNLKTDIADKLVKHTPLGRLAELQDVTGPVMYLLSDSSAMVTGTINPIEGGLFCNCAE